MAVIKVIEILAESDKGWEDATNEALKAASKSVKNIKTIYIKDFQAMVENDQITKYRVNTKISFLVD